MFTTLEDYLAQFAAPDEDDEMELPVIFIEDAATLTAIRRWHEANPDFEPGFRFVFAESEPP